MSFTFALYPHPSQNTFKAQAQKVKTWTMEDAVKELTKEGSILKDLECNVVINAFFNLLAKNLEQGIGFKSDFIVVMPGISGTFETEDEKFDKKKHKTKANVSSGPKLQAAAKKIEPKKVKATPPKKARIKEVTSLVSDPTPLEIAPNAPLEITGELLSIDPTQPDEGVFLIESTTQQEHPLDYSYHNKPSKLLCRIPETLTAGRYYLEVRNRPFRAKSLRITRFIERLTVT